MSPDGATTSLLSLPNSEKNALEFSFFRPGGQMFNKECVLGKLVASLRFAQFDTSVLEEGPRFCL